MKMTAMTGHWVKGRFTKTAVTAIEVSKQTIKEVQEKLKKDSVVEFFEFVY